MVTEEIMAATVQEYRREAAEIERQAEALRGQGTAPRRLPSAQHLGWIPVPSVVARLFRTASAS